MLPNDITECAGIIADHPVIGPRYGQVIQDLSPAWLRLVGSEAMRSAVFEEVEGRRARIWGVGVGVFVTDDYVRELKKPPQFWSGPELATRIMRGTSPVLSDRQVREANSSDGLNLLVWEALPRDEYARADSFHFMVNTYIEIHRGYLLKEMITSPIESVERLHWAVDGGGLFWDPVEARYTKSLKTSAEDFIREPHVVGVTRELESTRMGSWVGSLFDYRPPLFGFSPSEQQLLLSALACETGTDHELSKDLHVSLPTVKKMWLSIYGRVANCMPDLIPDSAQVRSETAERGKEKRRRVLAYVRAHPEELRPVSRQLLRQRRPPTAAHGEQ
jgi:hypothetical protein